MSYSNYFSIVLLIVLVAFLALIKNRWKYKKGIMFHVSSIAMIPIFLAAAMGLYVGWYGMIHFVWGAVVILGTATIGYEIITKKLQKPLNEMLRAIDALSKGDVDVVIDEKYLKGEHELANIMRRMHKLVGALKNIAAFANHVGKGDLNVEYTLLDEKDSLGKSMLDMRSNLVKAEAEMEKNKREDERRNWVTQGIAKFAGLLRDNNDNIEELCQSIVSNLVKHIGANQAGIFILNDDDAENPILELKACYAYERRKFLQKTIQIGEGLVGACFLERETIYMTNLPKNYINITSGLGEDTPKALLIVPLKVNEAIYGIIEIAAFKAFEPHVREFVEKVSESIASTIGTVKVNMNTNKLLEQTKLQTEEMINQEEELRQNMEEMQATQEEMFRREAELKETMAKMRDVQTTAEDKEHEMQQLHNAIFETYSILEFSADAYIVDINENILRLFGSTDRSDFVGKHITNFISQEEYELVWRNAEQGKAYETVQQVEAKGKTNNLHQRYVPICDKKGKLLRVLDLVFIENS